jgi:hypothetical protein
MTVRGGMVDAEINNVIYMELYSRPKMARGKCGKTNVAGSIDRDSTVFNFTQSSHINVSYMFSMSF